MSLNRAIHAQTDGAIVNKHSSTERCMNPKYVQKGFRNLNNPILDDNAQNHFDTLYQPPNNCAILLRSMTTSSSSSVDHGWGGLLHH